MSIINVPVLGSPNNLRRQLQNGVLTDVSTMPHSPRPKTLRPRERRGGVHYEPERVDGGNSEVRPASGNKHPRRAPTPARPRSPVVRDFAYPGNLGQAVTEKAGTSNMPLKRKLGLRRSKQNSIPPPMPISFDETLRDNDAAAYNNNQEPTPIPSMSRSTLRQKVSESRLRQAQMSDLPPSSQTNAQPVEPDSTRSGRRFFDFMRKNTAIPTVEPPIEQPLPSKPVRLKSISSKRLGTGGIRGRGKTRASGGPAPAPAPVPREVSRSRTTLDARRGRVFSARDIPNIEIRSPTPPPTVPLEDGGPPRRGRQPAMSVPNIRAPNVQAPKPLGFPKWRAGAGAGVDAGGGGDRAAAGDGVAMPDRPPSVRHERGRPLLQDLPSSSRQRTASPSTRQYIPSSPSNRPPPSQQRVTSSLPANGPPSIRPRAPSPGPPSLRQRAPSPPSNRPPSMRQRAASLQSSTPRPMIPLEDDHVPLLDEPTTWRRGRMPAMSIPKIRLPNMQAPKRLGFPKWRTGAGAGAGAGVGGGGDIAAAVDGVAMPDRPHSVRHEREPSSLQALPPSRQRAASPSARQDIPSLPSNRSPPNRQGVTSLQANHPPSIRQRAPSPQSNRPPSMRQRATSLQSSTRPLIPLEDDVPPRDEPTTWRRGRMPAMSVPKIRMPNMHVPKRLGFPKWRTGAGAGAGVDAGDSVAMPDRPPSVRREREPSLPSNRPPPNRPRVTSLQANDSPSIRQRAAPQSNQPPYIRPRATSLQSTRPPSHRHSYTPSITPHHNQAQSPRSSIHRASQRAPSPVPSTPRTRARDPAAPSSNPYSGAMTTKRGRLPTTFKMRMPEFRVWRTKEAPGLVPRPQPRPRQRAQVTTLTLVPTSSRDKLTPSPASFQQLPPRSRVRVRATRPVLHRLLLPPTLLQPARLHWDVRDPHLAQRGLVEQMLKEPFITATSTSTYHSFSLHIPIPTPISSSRFSFSPFTSLMSLINNAESRQSTEEYWTAPITRFSTSASDPDTLIPPTVLQILTIISTTLRTRATPEELAMLNDERNWRYRAEVEEVFRRRCEREDREREMEKGRRGLGRRGGGGRQERVGIRRVDLLGRKTRWLGLERGKYVEGWIVRLGNMTLR